MFSEINLKRCLKGRSVQYHKYDKSYRGGGTSQYECDDGIWDVVSS